MRLTVTLLVSAAARAKVMLKSVRYITQGFIQQLETH